MAFRTLLLLAFVFISAEGEELFKPCAHGDYECVKVTTQTFFTTVYSGITKWGIEPTDPLIIPSVEIDVTKEWGFVYHYTNVNITGLKNLQISEYKLNLETKVETLKIKADISVVADVEIKLTEFNKTFEGNYSATTTVLGTAEYGVGVKIVDGKEYFVVGPETITSETVGEPTVTIGSDLQAAVDKDKDAVNLRPQWESNLKPRREKILTAIANKGFATLVNNLRALVNVLEKSKFIKDE